MIAVLPGAVVTGGAPSIGSVAMLPQYRAQGLASASLGRIWSDLNENGTAVALISGRRDLYDRLGAVPAGAFLGASWSPTIRTDGDVAVTKPQDGRAVANALTDLYHAESTRYRRTADEMADLVATLAYPRRGTTHELFVAENSGRVEAYAVVGVSVRWAGAASWSGPELVGTLSPIDSLGTMAVLSPERLVHGARAMARRAPWRPLWDPGGGQGERAGGGTEYVASWRLRESR